MQRLIFCFIAAFGAMQLGWAQDQGSGLPDRQILVIDPGRHTAPIKRADVDRDGAIAVTGSDDRTVRVWSLADGRLLRTIRVPQGPGDVGKIFAVAIDPDGEVIAAAGWTRWTPEDPQEQIYLFDAGSGATIGRIGGLPTVVNHLTFSPDGRRLAAVLGSGAGLRIYDRDGWPTRTMVRTAMAPPSRRTGGWQRQATMAGCASTMPTAIS